MMHNIDMIFFWGLVLLVSALLALVEIEIEGADGYGKRLPVRWRTNNKWIRLFITGTSYHLFMGLFLLALVHLPFVVGLPWGVGNEMLILSFLAFVTLLEDFLWFVLNPARDGTGKRLYGIRNFNKRHIPWFSYWFGGLPIWYWWYLPIGTLLYWGSRVLL